MITFLRVSKSIVYREKGRALPRPSLRVFANCTATIPHSLFASVESDEAEIKTAFLQLVFGTLKPDRGRVFTHGVRCSPVLNLSGHAGPLLVPQITVRENIGFQSRLSHFSASAALDFVADACDCRNDLDQTVALLKPLLRRAIEASIFSLIPYDCYLVDHFDLLPDFAKIQLYYVAKSRGAGLLFSSSRPGVSKQFRDATISLDDGALVCENVA